MATAVQRSIEVFRVRPVIFWVIIFAALVFQAVLPLKIPLARLFDFPLLVTVYFALLRRNKVFGIALGTGMGLVQDALSHGFIGILGMTKALVGYFGAAASVKFDFDRILPRILLVGILVAVHNLFLQGLRHGLLEYPPPFVPLDLVSAVLVNVALGLILFLLFDRFRKPA